MTDHDHEQAHEHQHDEVDVAAMFEQPWWEDRYGQPDAVWSGNPNERLVEQAGDLAAGAALEVGCGEGADAIWLASRGWTVTAVDFSQAGLDRARQHAEAAGRDLAGRITWQRVDVRSWAAPAASYDLVTAHYFHQPAALRQQLFAGLAAAVRPGGT